MNKDSFLKELEELLSDLPEEERKEAFIFNSSRQDSFTRFPLICSGVSSRHSTAGPECLSSFRMYA